MTCKSKISSKNGTLFRNQFTCRKQVETFMSMQHKAGSSYLKCSIYPVVDSFKPSDWIAIYKLILKIQMEHKEFQLWNLHLAVSLTIQ